MFSKTKKLFLFSKFFRIFAAKFSIRKKVMVKQRIIEEATELFGRSGVRSITMDDLARHLGISKRTIYENFKDKEELLIACIDAFHYERQIHTDKVFLESDNVADALLMLFQMSAGKQAQRHFNMMNDIRKYYPQVFKEHLSHFHHDKHMKMELMIQRGIHEGIFRDDLNVNIIAHFFSEQIDDIVHNDRDLDKYSLADCFENVVITFLRGVCTLKGIEIIDRYKKKV